MYEDFFQLDTLPFSLTPNPNFFCQLRGHQEALNILLFCLNSGEGFIKIIGEVGSGKSLLCRKLLDSLDESFITAYIPNPNFSPNELVKAFARELKIDTNAAQDQHELTTMIYNHLIELHRSNKKTVLMIDEAQALSDEALETIRLLTNLETKTSKLLQVVLFGQPELDERLSKSHLRQLKQRISFSYTLPLMNKDDLDVYLYHRLAKAGYKQGNLFSGNARKILLKASNGIPRLVNILSHKALLVAYGKGEKEITNKAMHAAINDTESISNIFQRRVRNIIIAGLIATMIAIILINLAWSI